MNIGSQSKYPANSLSNFAIHPFVIDGVDCSSMEGFLQSLKFDKPHIQIEVCKLVGIKAKRRGQKRNKAWKSIQTLWWKGQAIKRDSIEYQDLLDRAYSVLSKNESFKRALYASGRSKLTHSIGKTKISDTVLTESEFCIRLNKIRKKLK